MLAFGVGPVEAAVELVGEVGEAGDLDPEAERLAVAGEPLGLGREVVERAVAVDVGAVGDDEDVVDRGAGEGGGLVEGDRRVVEGELARGGDEGGVAAEGGDVVAEAELGAGGLGAVEADGAEGVGDVPDRGGAGVREAGEAELGRAGGGAGGAAEAVGAGPIQVAVVELEPVEEGAGIGDGRARGVGLPLPHELEEALRPGDEARGEGIALPAADGEVAAEAPPGDEGVLGGGEPGVAGAEEEGPEVDLAVLPGHHQGAGDDGAARVDVVEGEGKGEGPALGVDAVGIAEVGAREVAGQVPGEDGLVRFVGMRRGGARRVVVVDPVLLEVEGVGEGGGGGAPCPRSSPDAR